MAPPLKVQICCGTVLVLLAITIGLIASSLKKLNTEEAGLQYDVHMHKLKDQVYTAGLHLGPPGFRFIVFPRVYRTLAFHNIECLNKDGLEIGVNVQFQYLAQLTGKSLKKLVMEFENHSRYQEVVRDTAEEVIHNACGDFNVTQFQTSRNQFQGLILSNLNERLNNEFSTNVRDVQVNNIQRPHAYERVLQEKESARQNIKIVLQERPRILLAAKTKKMESDTQAIITLNEARTDARIMLAKAEANAKAILNAYTTEAETYHQILLNQNLTTTGLLSYLATRAIQTAGKPIHINIDAPAQTSFSLDPKSAKSGN